MKILNLCVVYCVLQCAAAFGYGDEGHQVVGALAAELIQGSAAETHVKSLLGVESLATASTWADQAKGWGTQTEEMHRFVSANPNHAQFHYTDIPFQESHYSDTSIGATNIDVVHAAKACVLILQGKPEQQKVFKDVDSKTALRLLVHYIGDMHQPLHVGAGYLNGTNFINPNTVSSRHMDDHGGNSLSYKEKNLHFFWDITAVRIAMTNDQAITSTDLAKKLLSHPGALWTSAKPPVEWINEWADQSLVLSAEVHRVAVLGKETYTDSRSGKTYPRWRIAPMDPGYEAWASKTVETELTMAGYRLAALLKAIWPE